ncbi:histidine-binding periplasmic protein-like [Saccoglossus kowalevskii]|uniref:Uncharacterized protein LOC100376747 n=1 Tax=Saccoglossus kowalevskii TaxID=10224 RepID=A0ABM0GYQ6_SACKO|nr:PREDICTED: uncharacterized protein LOC100376747 [Saccoglossus kowalevskii]
MARLVIEGLLLLAVFVQCGGTSDDRGSDTPNYARTYFELFLNGISSDEDNPFNSLSLPRTDYLSQAETRAIPARYASQLMHRESQPQNFLTDIMLMRTLAPLVEKDTLDEMEDRIQNERIYTFAAVLLCNCPMEYIAEDGELKGFAIDLINEVCKLAGKKCIVQHDAPYKCYRHEAGLHSVAGDGLLGRQYDACTTYVRTREREHCVAFTESYWQQNTTSRFFVRDGNHDNFDPANITGKTIGFMDGWVSDEACLSHGRNWIDGAAKLDPGKAVYFKNRKSMFDAVASGEIDAAFLFAVAAYGVTENGFDVLGVGVECGIQSTSHFMTRKDSSLLSWFNPTLRLMKRTGQYHKLCHEAVAKHGHKGKIRCV